MTHSNQKYSLSLDLEKKALNQNLVTTFYNVTLNSNEKITSKEVISVTSEIVNTFSLKEVTLLELTELRDSSIPGFVLKEGNSYFYTKIKKNWPFVSRNLFTSSHMCGCSCSHMSAASDEDGGCKKVRNKATFIEMYDWITLGYETFNVKHSAFVVAKCDKHEFSLPTKTTKRYSKALTPEERYSYEVQTLF